MSRATLGLSSTFQGGEHPAGTRLPFARSLLKGMRNASLSAGINSKTSPSAEFKDCLSKWEEED